ncbi:LuxR C-terminal-related transcriptional regulator [Candidatus Berkiella aquae]|uniref:Bacterial regulatory protein, luxR family n=1 Tax=Candidatus Berkiella aquae TaxID=295108 RepID=A0A0Q9YVM8_9GAMM|nr:LuxR C-terminal-related transcriptional regulator [Candidatus Berkiella aquae]MCS5710103.1 LuxR C-terminal-related transcriptional regulator [Candidatus Berkiella aquae]
MQFDRFFDAKTSLQQLIAPLQKMANLTYFSYGVNYADSAFSLSTHPEYFYSALEKTFPLVGCQLTDGWHTWDKILSSEHKHLVQENGADHGILWIKHHHNKTEVIEFASTPDNPMILDFYLNHQNLLKKFIAYFRREAHHLIEKADARRFAYTANQMPVHSPQSNQQWLQAISDPTFEMLSKREKECYTLLIKGYMLAEIGQELNLALPTVANYIARIKQKLACDNKWELVTKGQQAKIVEYHIP